MNTKILLNKSFINQILKIARSRDGFRFGRFNSDSHSLENAINLIKTSLS